MHYELWNSRTRNLAGSFESEGEALAAVRAMTHAHGEAYGERLVLAVEDRAGQTTTIAAGAELVRRADTGAVSPPVAMDALAGQI